MEFYTGYPPLSWGVYFKTFDETLAFLKWYCINDDLRVCESESPNMVLVHNDKLASEIQTRCNDGREQFWIDGIIRRHTPMHIHSIARQTLAPSHLNLVHVPLNNCNNPPRGNDVWCKWSVDKGLEECDDQRNPDTRHVHSMTELVDREFGYMFHRY